MSKGELPPKYWLYDEEEGFFDGPFDNYGAALEAAEYFTEVHGSVEIWTRFFRLRPRQPGELEAGAVNEETLPSAGPGQLVIAEEADELDMPDDMAFWWGIP